MGAPTMPDPEGDFDAFYRRTLDHVRSVLWRAGVRREAVREELAQEVYLQAHRGLGSRNPAAPERAWVCAIAWHVVLTHAKLRRTRAEEPTDEAPEEPISTEPSAEEVVADRRRYLALAESTTWERRIVFEMFEVEGWTKEEISAALSLPVGTVATRLRLAREDLTAAAARMSARERRSGHDFTAPLLLPFGEGAWRSVARLFEGASPGGAEERVRRATTGAITRVVARGARFGGKAAVLASSAFVLGGVAGGVLVHALHVMAAEPPRPASLPIAPEPVMVAAAPSPIPPSAVPVLSAAPRMSTTPPVTIPPHPPASASDPSERRLMARVESALNRDRLDEARALLEERDRLFPPGRARLGAEFARLRAKLDAVSAVDGGP